MPAEPSGSVEPQLKTTAVVNVGIKTQILHYQTQLPTEVTLNLGTHRH